MQQADKPQFLAILNGLAAMKPGAKLTVEGLTMFWDSMSHWEIDDFRAAAAQLARTSEFMPNPFHFEQLRKASRMSAGEAWSEVLAIARAGESHHGDPVIDAAVRSLGGYRAIGMSNTDSTHFLERRFAEHYEAIGEREEVRDALPRITGGSRLKGPQSLANLLPRQP